MEDATLEVDTLFPGLGWGNVNEVTDDVDGFGLLFEKFI